MTRGLSLHIDLDILIQNYQRLEKQLQGRARMSVAVKADAYGLGIEKLAPLYYGMGCRNFFVARIGEADYLRSLISDDAAIYVLDGITKESEYETFKNKKITPVVNTLDQLKLACGLPVVLHFDTGMNRLGFSWDDISRIKKLSPQIQMIMTHPACADEDDKSLTEKQFRQFKAIRSEFRDIPASFCNSAALFSDDEWHLDLVRPGIALYGGVSLSHDQTHIQNVVSLYAPVLQTRVLQKGEKVGYGATYTAKDVMDTAIVGIGYADGLFRQLSNRGYIFYRGQKCPIIGRVSMDLTIIDISACSPKPKAQDMVEILGPHQSVDDLANLADTIGYDVLTRLGKTLKKCYSR